MRFIDLVSKIMVYTFQWILILIRKVLLSWLHAANEIKCTWVHFLYVSTNSYNFIESFFPPRRQMVTYKFNS